VILSQGFRFVIHLMEIHDDIVIITKKRNKKALFENNLKIISTKIRVFLLLNSINYGSIVFIQR